MTTIFLFGWSGFEDFAKIARHTQTKTPAFANRRFCCLNVCYKKLNDTNGLGATAPRGL
jgi:hypothetical protein